MNHWNVYDQFQNGSFLQKAIIKWFELTLNLFLSYHVRFEVLIFLS